MRYAPYLHGRDPRPGEAAIYVLDAPDGSPSYVGVTTGRLRRRLKDQWLFPIGARLQAWIRSLAEPPRLRVLMYVPAAEAMRWEKAAIRAHLAEGHALVNTHR